MLLLVFADELVLVLGLAFVVVPALAGVVMVAPTDGVVDWVTNLWLVWSAAAVELPEELLWELLVEGTVEIETERETEVDIEVDTELEIEVDMEVDTDVDVGVELKLELEVDGVVELKLEDMILELDG